MAFRLRSVLDLFRKSSRADAPSAYVSARLGVDGLAPEAMDMKPGGLYVLMLPEQFDAVPLVADTLALSLMAGSHVGICDTAADKLGKALSGRLSHLEQPQLLHSHLSLFSYDRRLLRRPTDNIWDFTSGLEDLGLHRADCLILLNASQLMPAYSRAAMERQLRIYHEWLAYHGVAGLFVVHPVDLLWTELLRHAKWLAGLARLQQEQDRMTWQVALWHGTGSPLENSRFPLGRHADGSLYSLAAYQEQTALAKPAQDEHRVLSCWDPARRGQSTPANWEIHADADSLVKEARQSAIAATIILEHTDPARFEALARQIHALRLGCGRRLKIIVREAAGRIDYAHEMQLYHVGASRILRADMSLSDCFRAISALKGQWFWRAIEPDFDSFYASFNTSERFGYLAPVDFTATADEFMRCGLNTNLDSVLVRLTLRSDQHHLAVINAFHADRPGVFLTTDDKHIYLFLFACPASDIDATMSRQFAQPVGDLFSFYEVIVVPKEIEEELDRLRYNAEYVGYTDYSELLQAQASGGMH